MPAWAMIKCQQCGAPIGQAAKGRPRRFCCGACRTASYRVTKVNRTGQANMGHIIYQAGAAGAQGGTAGQPGGKLSDGDEQ